MRSGHPRKPLISTSARIISACAERTRGLRPGRPIAWDHLRVCGADAVVSHGSICGLGSSPRVRSGPGHPLDPEPYPGIISACAERTRTTRRPWSRNGDHLRVCGADEVDVEELDRALGSSPRVRSGPGHPHRNRLHRGIISACAERTNAANCASCPTRDHLRVCGADSVTSPTCRRGLGSSPRVRSGRTQSQPRRIPHGIISACAERTRACGIGCGTWWDHLRVCGADWVKKLPMAGSAGSSPRVRSGRSAELQHDPARGIISACAERTGSRRWSP